MAAGSGDLPRLWDREAELAEIARALARVRGGEARLLVLRGPAGMGKSALLQDAQRLAEETGVVVLRARAAPVEREYPYGVVRQLFEPVLARGGTRAVTLLSGAAAGARDVLGDSRGASVTGDTSFASCSDTALLRWRRNDRSSWRRRGYRGLSHGSSLQP
jgi:hypothetical protein